MKRAIVVGSEGQDGRILSDRLKADGVHVLGIGRGKVQCTSEARGPIDITSPAEVMDAVQWWQPSRVFYLAAVHSSSENQSSVSDATLFERSLEINVLSVVNFLEALASNSSGSSLFYAASSHVFGTPETEIQDERTPLNPDSVYGISKTAGIHACRYYRASRNVSASVGILYNHESPLRRSEFVSQKIVRAAVEISRGRANELVIGDLGAAVDWGYAPDFVDAMIRIAELPESDDFVVATGEAHSVNEFVEIAFARLGLDWRNYVKEDRSLVRRSPAVRIGNSRRLRERTGWRPSVSFSEMVEKLVDAARERLAS